MEAGTTASDSIGIEIRRTGRQGEEMLGIMIRKGGVALWCGYLRMHADSYRMKIAKSALPTGVSQITLFLPDGTPVSERLVFVNNHDHLRLSVKTPEAFPGPREKVSLELTATDVYGQPVQGSFSVSVTDRSQARDTARYGGNLLTHLLLTSDIRGRVEDPLWYFEADTREKREALELLLLTQGWRRYIWEMAASGTPPVLPHPVERGIPVGGTVRNLTTGRPDIFFGRFPAGFFP
jgi:hypothetical protein